jgi:arylsulfatase A-like enzyme
MPTILPSDAGTASLSRRALLTASAAGALPLAGASQPQPSPSSKPNIVIIIADQVRWDAVGAYGLNPMPLTPNIDQMAARGTLYRKMFTNQPVCSPSRACLFTGEYPAKHGVWKNAGEGVSLSPSATTIATECRKAGYSANYIGKWHLAEGTRGPVPAAGRGGFLDLWEASNELEWTSHPYEGDIYDGDGRPLHFQNEYRVDFLTGRAKRFLGNVSKSSPFLLVVSYLEPHQQNDLQRMVAPNGYRERYQNPYVPEDLKRFPGNWQEQLPDYYGCLKRIDEAVGDIRSTLRDLQLSRNTVVVFISDHSCHFMTRNTEYKRSAHDASIHIPLIMEGPGFEGGREVLHMVSMVDVTPTLLDAAKLPIPASMQGKSTMHLVAGDASGWRDEVFVQMSEFWVARALRTPEWTYALAAPRTGERFRPAPHAARYSAFQLYDNRADPHQLVNLAGRKETSAVEDMLRDRLKNRMQEIGDFPAELTACPFPYA